MGVVCVFCLECTHTLLITRQLFVVFLQSCDLICFFLSVFLSRVLVSHGVGVCVRTVYCIIVADVYLCLPPQ